MRPERLRLRKQWAANLLVVGTLTIFLPPKTAVSDELFVGGALDFQLGGSVVAVAATETAVILAEGAHIVRIERDGTSEEIMLSDNFARQVQDIAIWDRYVIVAVGSEGVAALDLRNPSRVEWRLRGLGDVQTIQLVNHELLVGSRDLGLIGFQLEGGGAPREYLRREIDGIVDIAANEAQIAILHGVGSAPELTLFEREGRGLELVGRVVLDLDWGSGGGAVEFSDDKLIVAVGASLFIVDVRDEDRPQVLGGTVLRSGGPATASSVAVFGGLAFVASTAELPGAGGLFIVDTNRADLPVWYTVGIPRAADVFVFDGKLFVALQEHGATELAISGEPILTEVWRIGRPGLAYGADIEDDRLYVAAGANGLLIFKLDVGEKPVLEQQISGARVDHESVIGVRVTSSAVFVATEPREWTLTSVRALTRDSDLMRLGDIRFSGSSVLEESGGGIIASIRYGEGGVKRFTLGADGELAETGALSLEAAYSSSIVGDTLLVASGRRGLVVCSISSAGEIIQTSELGFGFARVTDVGGAGERAYVALGSEGLGIVDLSDPSSPRLAEVIAVGVVDRVHVHEEHIVTASLCGAALSGDCVSEITILDIETLRVRDRFTLPGRLEDLNSDRGSLIAALGEGGLYALGASIENEDALFLPSVGK